MQKIENEQQVRVLGTKGQPSQSLDTIEYVETMALESSLKKKMECNPMADVSNREEISIRKWGYNVSCSKVAQVKMAYMQKKGLRGSEECKSTKAREEEWHIE